jgi:glycosyltransferase involved in cell wall biosynthesis
LAFKFSRKVKHSLLKSTKMDNGISIVICCFNSAPRIRETLHAIFKLTVPDGMVCELIVVNNNSTDDTAEVVKATAGYLDRQFFQFKLVNEEKSGLSLARMTGVKSSSFNTIIFCDDDNHLDPNYLIIAYGLLSKYPDTGIIGGWCKPGFSLPNREWLEDFYGALAIEKFPRNEGCVNWVFGAGMVVSKSVFDKLKSQDIQLLLSDRSGLKQSSGGDTELCLLSRFVGYTIYYSPDLMLHHKVSEDRLMKKNFLKFNVDNFLPTMHLFILEKLINNKEARLSNILGYFLYERFIRFIGAIPRIILGKKIMINFLEFYGNLFLMGWLLLNVRRIKKTFYRIRINLYK